MESIVDGELAHPGDDRTLSDLQNEALRNYIDPGMLPVDAKKIRQIAGTGISFWNENFAKVAREVARQSIDFRPVYISNAGLLGIRQGVDVFKGTSREMLILVPDWINDQTSSICGYKIDLEEEKEKRVTFLSKDFHRPEEFIFIDDTKRTGSHLRDIWQFWSNNSGEPMPDRNVRVIITVPQTTPI